MTPAEALAKIEEFRSEYLTPEQYRLIQAWMSVAGLSSLDVKYDVHTDRQYLQIPKETING